MFQNDDDIVDDVEYDDPNPEDDDAGAVYYRAAGILSQARGTERTQLARHRAEIS